MTPEDALKATCLDTLPTEERPPAMQKMIEAGGLDPEIMTELRALFEAVTTENEID